MLSAENLLYNNQHHQQQTNTANTGLQQQDDLNSNAVSNLVNNNANEAAALAGISLVEDAKRRKAVSASSILGKIVVTDLPTGEKISQWGGTECYLSFISGHGPCLVVRGCRHKKGEGTFFQLRLLERVLHQFVEQGKLTLQMPHQKRACMIFITTTDSQSLPHLALMATTLDDRRRWGDLEMNVGRGLGGPARRGRKAAGGGGEEEDGEAEVMVTKPSARDALLMQDENLNFA